MEKIDLKPLSVNDAWRGRRFKTPAYEDYEYDLFPLLPNNIKIPEGKLKLYLEFGFSNDGSDWDNPIKPFVDILQKKYNFNDKRIYRSIVDKKIVKKGEEYIKFKILSTNPTGRKIYEKITK